MASQRMSNTQRFPAKWQVAHSNHDFWTQPHDNHGVLDYNQSLPRERFDTPDCPDESFHPNFTHEPLNLLSGALSIRLVEILPPGSKGLIRCRMRPLEVDMKSLGDSPDDQPDQHPYTCLSYVWGTGKMRRILINERSYEVRQNLWDFLYTLSSWKAHEQKEGLSHCPLGFDMDLCTRSLWIDALCINQDDLAERNHQVQQMGEIYSNAQQVVSWFGSDLFTASIFQLIRNHASGKAQPEPENSIVAHARKIINFSNHEYWKRAWITQEVYLARDLYLLARTEMVSIKTIQHMAATTRKIHGQRLYRQLWQTVHDVRNQDDTAPLIENVWRFRDKTSSNPRDLVYSLLFISKDGWKCVVDYEASMPYLGLVILSLQEDGVCLCRVKLVLQALKIDREPFGEPRDSTMLWIEIFGYRVARDEQHESYSSCACCSAHITWAFILRHLHGSARPAYVFCLKCDHLEDSKDPDIGANSCFGHIIIVWTSAELEKTHACWHCFWVPPHPQYPGTETVPILLEEKINMAGNGYMEPIDKIHLSISVLGELTRLIYSNRGLTDEDLVQVARTPHRPGGFFAWKVKEFAVPSAYTSGHHQLEEENQKRRRKIQEWYCSIYGCMACHTADLHIGSYRSQTGGQL